MEPQFVIEVIQDSNCWEITAQYVSSGAIIVAAIIAAWLAGRKERVIYKKKTKYYESVIDIVEAKINVSFDGLIESKPDDTPNPEATEKLKACFNLLEGCSKEVEILKEQIVDFSIHCPSEATHELHFFFFFFEVFVESAREYYKHPNDDNFLDSLKKSAKMPIESIKKVSASIKGKKKTSSK